MDKMDTRNEDGTDAGIHFKPTDSQVDPPSASPTVIQPELSDGTSNDVVNDENTPLLRSECTPRRSITQACIAWAIKYRILLEAAGKVIALFLLVVLGLALLLVTLLPPIDPEHAPDVKIPRSFDDLKR